MESVRDIYADGSTARPLAVGDWVLWRAPGWTDQAHLLAHIPGGICAIDAKEGRWWADPLCVDDPKAITRAEAERILDPGPCNKTWHRLTPAEAVAWMAEHLAGEEKR